ncbi:MAG: hypothetical protein IAA73_08040 [Bacteroidetes bacterium]|uniref:Uncharacterized protein n=1 Tax=Candidatus Gallipaludibacter merdavium TaxID=2840839 RepID=A0A9D9N4V5_9BACT|nr:hypothetical protein [Candidatus Gallipaludibacter merdavium]
MKTILKYLGAIIVLLGVVALAIYYYVAPSNAWLAVGGCAMVIGLLAHIIINHYIQD